MDRLTASGYRNAINAALDIIPEPIRALLDVDFLCGVDPLFAGLHHFEDASYGRSYRTTAHCVHPHHQAHLPKTRRQTTVVLPIRQDADPKVIVHELAHALDERMGWEHLATPVTRYAETNKFEAFAEAFTSWCIPGYAEVPDAATRDYFDRLTWERGAMRAS